MSDAFRLDGTRVLVTGANTSIVSDVAEEMARAGAEVVCAGRSSCDETVAAIDAEGGRADALHLGWREIRDIAGAAVALCSPTAEYIHGAVPNVDGGWLAR